MTTAKASVESPSVATPCRKRTDGEFVSRVLWDRGWRTTLAWVLVCTAASGVYVPMQQAPVATAAAPTSSSAVQTAWRLFETEHFEIHYVQLLASERDRVGHTAEQAYQHVSARLNFSLATKVPVVLFESGGELTRDEVTAYANSDDVAPPKPHRSRIVLPLQEETAAELDALVLRHELTHILVYEILSPGVGGRGVVPLWIHEGLANYMVGEWADADIRQMSDLIASGNVPPVSQLEGDGGFANKRLNNTLGHAAFDYIEERWGPDRMRRLLDALAAAPDVSPYEAVFNLTPALFDATFKQYLERRFGSRVPQPGPGQR